MDDIRQLDVVALEQTVVDFSGLEEGIASVYCSRAGRPRDILPKEKLKPLSDADPFVFQILQSLDQRVGSGGKDRKGRSSGGPIQELNA